MKFNIFIILILTSLLSACNKQNYESFMFWCARPEIKTSTYFIPSLQEGEEIEKYIKHIDGYQSLSIEYNKKLAHISYSTSQCRYMNFARELEKSGYDNYPYVQN